MAARTLALALSIWVFASSFALPRPDPSFTSAWLTGLASALVAVLALRVERARWAGAAAGLWLAASPAVLPRTLPGVRLHDLCAGLALLGLSSLPGRAPRRARS